MAGDEWSFSPVAFIGQFVLIGVVGIYCYQLHDEAVYYKRHYNECHAHAQFNSDHCDCWRNVHARANTKQERGNEDTDRKQDLHWKLQKLTTLVDTTCATHRHSPQCMRLYERRFACERDVQIWTSMARASNWTYDPWADAPTDVMHARLEAWTYHPGLATAC